ncbi:MAG: hypothetical protein ABFS22_02055 [Pseudomonadota bacterium]
MSIEESAMEPTMDPNSLYREEVITDQRMGTIRSLTPVNSDGTTDSSRAVIYSGQIQIMTPAGSLPVAFEIEAGSLGEAVGKFPDAAKRAVDDTMAKLKELQREAASSIVIPEAGGGLPGGGKIQLP